MERSDNQLWSFCIWEWKQEFYFRLSSESFYRERYIQASKEHEHLRKKLESQAEQEIEELSNQKRTLERKVRQLYIVSGIRPVQITVCFCTCGLLAKRNVWALTWYKHIGNSCRKQRKFLRRGRILTFKASFDCVIWQTDPRLVSNRSVEERLRWNCCIRRNLCAHTITVPLYYLRLRKTS